MTSLQTPDTEPPATAASSTRPSAQSLPNLQFQVPELQSGQNNRHTRMKQNPLAAYRGRVSRPGGIAPPAHVLLTKAPAPVLASRTIFLPTRTTENSPLVHKRNRVPEWIFRVEHTLSPRLCLNRCLDLATGIADAVECCFKLIGRKIDVLTGVVQPPCANLVSICNGIVAS